MSDHHGWYRNPKRVGSVLRNATSIAEQHRLYAELDRGEKCGRIGGDITREARGKQPTAGGDFRSGSNDAIGRIGHQGPDDRHVETVRAQGRDATIAEEESLDGDRN